jgi:hypothetical protein
MRFRLGGCAVALVLVLSACGADGGSDGAAPGVDAMPAEVVADLASARDTLPPAPHAATALTVLLAHDGPADDPGLDAAAGALAQRPDIAVTVAVPGTGAGSTTTMSGFPVVEVAATSTGFVADAVAATGIHPDLVVVGIARATEVGGGEPLARSATAIGVPALVVGAGDGDQVDLAAAAMQLLEVLDLELGALLDEPAGVSRLTVPSCGQGSLRGRVGARAAATATPLAPAQCTLASRSVPADEVDALAAGYAALVRLP